MTIVAALIGNSGISFSPHTDPFNSGFGNVTIPAGAASLTITRLAGGGGGAPGTFDIPTGDVRGGGGGGEGGHNTQTIAIASSDWNNPIAYVVGAGASYPSTGASSSTTGSVNAGSVSSTVTGGVSGTAANSLGNPGGAGGSPSGAAGGSGSANVGGTGGGTNGGAGGATSGGGQSPGGAGLVSFAWS